MTVSEDKPTFERNGNPISKGGSKPEHFETTQFLGSFEVYKVENPQYIYAVASWRNDHKESRTWGWFAKEDDARIAVKMNSGDMHERTFTHVVIEKVPEGICPIESVVVQWYQWVYVNYEAYDGYWEECETPEEAENTVCFTIG